MGEQDAAGQQGAFSFLFKSLERAFPRKGEPPPVSRAPRNGRFSYACRLRGEARYRSEMGGDRALLAGQSFKLATKMLSVSRDAARLCFYIYRLFGGGVLPFLDGKQARCI